MFEPLTAHHANTAAQAAFLFSASAVVELGDELGLVRHFFPSEYQMNFSALQSFFGIGHRYDLLELGQGDGSFINEAAHVAELEVVLAFYFRPDHVCRNKIVSPLGPFHVSFQTYSDAYHYLNSELRREPVLPFGLFLGAGQRRIMAKCHEVKLTEADFPGRACQEMEDEGNWLKIQLIARSC